MREADVRHAVRANTLRPFFDDGNSLILDELCLCQGDARIDIAVVNCELHGFELKSDKDTLERLPSQIDIYSKVLDRITLVVGEKHFLKAQEMLPGWWGIIRAKQSRGRTYLKEIRTPQKNNLTDPYCLAQLLWKTEAISILGQIAGHGNLVRKTRNQLWHLLAENLTKEELNNHVRRILKNRKTWRSGPKPRRNGDSSLRIPKLFDCQSQHLS